MNSSASASSSPVVTPGRTCSPISASVSATTRPARAICSISCARLPDDHASPRSGDLLERVLDLGVDLVDRSLGMDRRRRCRASSGSTRRAARSARGRSRAVAAIASGVSSARPSSRARFEQPLEQRRVVGHLELEHDVERAADLGEQVVERLRLRERAREAVEDEAVARVVRGRAARGSARSSARRGRARRGRRSASRSRPSGVACLHRRAEDVAGRDVRDPYSPAIRFACVPLPEPCGPEQQDVQPLRYFRKPS